MSKVIPTSSPQGGDTLRTQITPESAYDALEAQGMRMAAARGMVPNDPLNTYVQSAASMSPDSLKSAYGRLYGPGANASLNYGSMDVPAALRNKISNQLAGASSSGLNQLNRGATDDYMKIQNMYQSLQDSKVRSEMAKAQNAQADYEAKKAKKAATISAGLGLAGTAAGAGLGGAPGAAIGGGAGSMFGGLL